MFIVKILRCGCHFLRYLAIWHANELTPRTGGICKGTENIKDGANLQFSADRDDVFRCRMECRRKEKHNTGVSKYALGLFGRKIDIDA